MWESGIFNGFKWEAKIYNEGSEYGINNGRVSKLFVKNGESYVITYDRGWDIEPETDELKEWLKDFLKYVDENIEEYEV